MQVLLKKGWETVDLEVEDSKILQLLHGKKTAPLTTETINDTIFNGIRAHSPSDIKAKKIVLIIPDNTRLWARGDLYVPVVIQGLLSLGVSEENISVVIALGTHAEISEHQFAELAGEYTCKQLKILNSANKNTQRLIDLGTTTRGTNITITKEVMEADHLIIFGGVLHHMIAGYGGGRKYLFPGVGGYDAIQQNHSLTLDENGLPHPLVRQAQLEGNPVHEDIEEICAGILQEKSCCYISVAVNGEGDIFHCSVGELQENFVKSCRVLDEFCSVPISERADFVLCSAGGHRTDGQLYQSVKALFNGVEALKEGGTLVLVAECREGYGNSVFGETLKKYRTMPSKLGKKLHADFSMPAYIALRVIQLQRNYNIALISSFSQAETEELGFLYVKDLKNYGKKLPGKGYIVPFAENVLPVLNVSTI